MLVVGRRLRAAGVSAVFVLDGGLLGPEVAEVLLTLARRSESAGAAGRRAIAGIVSRLVGSTAEYSEQYVARFRAAVNPRGSTPIDVRRFTWWSENHHIARADGAVRLVDAVLGHSLECGGQVLLWGHGHAGNVFALLTALLGGDRERITRFFAAAGIYYRWPLVGCVDIPVWQRVCEVLLDDAQRRRLAAAVDIVTFGTPVRYGWHPQGSRRLMHFIHRRAKPRREADLPEEPAAAPPIEDVLAARGGDYYQRYAGGSCEPAPSVFAWRSRMAERRLKRILRIDPPHPPATGPAVPAEGETLLVDYGPAQGDIGEHFAGHAIYTRSEWLLFHAEEVARRFYAADEPAGSTGEPAASGIQ